MSCRDCNLVTIQGIACHETGCPRESRLCRWCGTSFDPFEAGSRVVCGHSCETAWRGLPCDCPECEPFEECEVDSALETLGGAL